jgi:hypothetical protein
MSFLKGCAVVAAASSVFTFAPSQAANEQFSARPLTARSFSASYNSYQKMKGKKVALTQFDEPKNPEICRQECQQTYDNVFTDCMRYAPTSPDQYYEARNNCDSIAYDAQLDCEVSCY